jgi:hypothetical protein
MATFHKFDCVVEDVAEGKHNFASDALYVMLSNVQPVVGNTVKGSITQIAAGNGYATDGKQATLTSSGQAAGVYKLILADPGLWTAGPSDMAAFQFAVLYNFTSGTQPLIGWWDRGSALTLNGANADTFLGDMPGTEILSIT